MHTSPYNEEQDKQISGSIIIRSEFHKQTSIYQGTNSARVKNKVDIQSAFEGDSDHQDSNQQDPNEKEKLAELRMKLKNMKDRIRAKNLVMNLPSRMLKNLDQNKFNILGDKTYNDEHVHIQQIALYEERIKEEKKAIRRKTQPKISAVINSGIIQSIEQGSADTLEINNQKNILRRVQSKQHSINLSRYLKNQWRWILKQNERLFNSLPILQPSSLIKMAWDVLYTMVILVCIFYLPIIIVFDYSYVYLIPKELLYVLPIILIIDILVNMNTGYFDKGQVVKNRIQIIQFYWQKNWLTDIISVIPFIISLYCDPGNEGYLKDEQINTQRNWIQSPIYKILLMTFFFKIFSLSQILRKIEERFNLSKRITNLFQLMKLLFTIILINHLFACLWVYAARLEEGYKVKTWITEAKIQDKEWYIKYLTAYYFTTVTMITVGYGDILPRNEVEMILCVITMMIACGVFGYSLNEVGQIFANFFQVDNEIKKKIGFIQRLMSKKNVNQKLQYEIREYLEYYWRETSEMNQEMELSIVSQLSESLRTKLMYESNKIVFKDSPIFKRNFSKTTMEQIVPLIQEMKFTPESFICLKGVQDDASIYFIEKGSVEILIDSKDKKPKSIFELNKGDSFGSHTFFTGLPRVNNIRSKEFTTVLKIRRQDFLQLIQTNSEDYETFCSIRDSISYLNDYSKIGQCCLSCSSQYHLVNECQYLHYIPNKAKIIKFYHDLLDVSNDERSFQERRKPSKKYKYRNSRFIFREVESQAEIFLDNYQSEINNNSEEDSFSDGYFQSEMNENIIQYTEEDNDKKYLLLENKNFTLNGKDQNNSNNQNPISPISNPNAFISQPRTLKSRQLLDINVSQTMNLIDIIEEDEQGENIEIQNINNQEGYNEKIEKQNKDDKQLIFRFPSLSGNQNTQQNEKQQQKSQQQIQQQSTQTNGLTPLIANRSSSKKNTETQFTIPTLYRSNTNRSDFQNNNNNNNGSSYSNHYQNTYMIPTSNNQLNSAQEDLLFQELLQNQGASNQMSPNSLKRNALRSITKKIVTGQKMFESGHRQGERKPSKVIHFEELGSPTSSIKQKFQSNKRITTDKIVNQMLQSKSTSSEQKNLDTILKQIQQLVANQQSYQLLQYQLEQSNNNQHQDEADLFNSFDRMKQFVKYNPRFNFSSVISRYNQFLDAKRKNLRVKKNERQQKGKGTQYGKQSQKNLEYPLSLDQRKFSKFSPINNQRNMNALFQEGLEPSIQNLPHTTQRLHSPDSESPNNLIIQQREKEHGLKLEAVQNHTQCNSESMNQIKMSNISSSQNFIISPNQTQREPLILSNKTIEFKRNNSFTYEDKDNKQVSYNGIGLNSKYGSSNKEETVDEEINSPSLHILPNNFDMRFSNLGQRSLQDYDAKQKK